MSKVEVNQVTQQCGTTLTVGGGACKTAVVDATTVTLGRCGGTVSLASGATQSGFGASGAVSWDTTPKTATFSAVTTNGYFVNTTSGGVTANLPAGSAGDIVAFSDYAGTWQTNGMTISANGSELINGIGADVILATEGLSVTLVYVDGTIGWKNIDDATSNVTGTSPYIVATGGTPCTGAIVGDYKVHTFTGPGTFCVTAQGAAAPCSGTGSNTVDYLVIAGGGSGGGSGGGGGAGGYRESPGTASGSYTVSPRGAAPAVALSVPIAGYPITVGAGAAAVGQGTCVTPASNGSNSVFSTITGSGGGPGGGQCRPAPEATGRDGGSGGGGTCSPGAAQQPGGASSPVTNPVQGTAGGAARPTNYAAGGGGGVICAGQVGQPGAAGAGGAGGTSNITNTPTQRAGGGGGGSYPGSGSPVPGGAAGAGGGGAGMPGTGPAINGTVNTGGGGGGGAPGGPGCTGAGGSGVVIIRYKFQN